jgi:hypothetical protein
MPWKAITLGDDGITPVEYEAYDANGVDIALIDEALRRTPRERLQALQDHVDATEELLARLGRSLP